MMNMIKTDGKKSAPKSFVRYLQDQHAIVYTGLDDDMPDAFDSWIADKDAAEMIDYAEEYGQLLRDTNAKSKTFKMTGDTIVYNVEGEDNNCRYTLYPPDVPRERQHSRMTLFAFVKMAKTGTPAMWRGCFEILRDIVKLTGK